MFWWFGQCNSDFRQTEDWPAILRGIPGLKDWTLCWPQRSSMSPKFYSVIFFNPTEPNAGNSYHVRKDESEGESWIIMDLSLSPPLGRNSMRLVRNKASHVTTDPSTRSWVCQPIARQRVQTSANGCCITIGRASQKVDSKWFEYDLNSFDMILNIQFLIS